MPATPDFRLHYSNALDVLAELLARELREAVPGRPLLAPDIVLIPQVAMRRWLQATLAAGHGVAANLEFLTPGEFVVRGIDRIDEKNRQIWFHASGRNSDQDPYFMQYYRVNFDGTGLVALTEADGNHSLQFSPDNKYAIDTYSRVDAPPKHELRRTYAAGA